MAQDCNDLVNITSSDTVVLVNTSISRFCLQCVNGSMVFASDTLWIINGDIVTDPTPAPEVVQVAGVLVLLDPMQLLMDALECNDVVNGVDYINIQVFSSSEAHSTPLCEADHSITPHSSCPPCDHISCQDIH